MRVEILAAACPDWLGPALILDAQQGTVAFANMPCLSLSCGEQTLIGTGGGLQFGSTGADERFRRALGSFRESADTGRLLFLPWEARSKSLALIFQRPTGFLKDLLVEAGDGATELILIQFERRPYKQARSRFFARVFSRLYDLTMAEEAMVGQIVRNIDAGLQVSAASGGAARLPQPLLTKLNCDDVHEFIEFVSELYA